jgi:Fe-S oxidoreductase
MQCSSFSKAIQVERIEEATETGARTLITACPKCQIHLSCALSNVESDIEITDLYTYLAGRLPAE